MLSRPSIQGATTQDCSVPDEENIMRKLALALAVISGLAGCTNAERGAVIGGLAVPRSEQQLEVTTCEMRSLAVRSGPSPVP